METDSHDPTEKPKSGFGSFDFRDFFGADKGPFAAVRTTRVAEELVALVKEYARQQTVNPLKALLRWLIFGLVGALLLLFGLALLSLAGLRALQTETGSAFTGSLSWLPYLIVVGGLLLVTLAAFVAMTKKPTGLPDAPKQKQKK